MAKSIEVTLTLNDKGFSKKVRSAKGEIDKLEVSSKKAGGGFGGLVGKFAIVGTAVAGVVGAFKGLSGALNVSKQFQDVETTLANLTGSAAKGKAALNQLIVAAEELPISFEELASAQPALATISPTLDDLKNNTQLAADIAGQFGISFEDAAGQLQRAFSGGAGAADIFREKGVLSAAGFEQGVSYSIDETISKLKEFGGEIEGAAQTLNQTLTGSISQAGDAFTLFQKATGDAISPELKAGIDVLVESFRANKEAILEFGTAIGTNLVEGFFAVGNAIALIIDIVTSLGRTFKSIFDGIKQVVGPFFKEFFEIAVRVLGFIIEQVAYVGIAFGELLDLLPGVDSTVTDFFTNVQNAAKNAREQGLDVFSNSAEGLFGEFTGGSTAARDAFSKFTEQVRSKAKEAREASETAAEAAKKVTGDAVIDIASGFGNAGEKTQKFSELFKELKEEFEDIESFELYNSMLERLQTLFNEGKLSTLEFKKAKEELDKVFMENNELYASFGKAIEGIAGGITDSLTNAIMEGESLIDGLKDTFKKAVAQMISDSLRLQIIQPLLQGIFGGNFGPGGYTPGGGGLLGNFFQGIFGRASGGPIMKGRPYVVGERGPEVIVPDMGGNVVPNNALGGGAVTYNINAVDARSFKQLVAEDPQFIYNVTRVGQRRQPT